MQSFYLLQEISHFRLQTETIIKLIIMDLVWVIYIEKTDDNKKELSM